MQFGHARDYLSAGDTVVVTCDHQCNVRVMNDPDFSSFRSGGRHSYHGGFFTHSPIRIGVPSSGYWNVAVDTAGRAAFRYNIGFIKTNVPEHPPETLPEGLE
jgi:hypothetical protein